MIAADTKSALRQPIVSSKGGKLDHQAGQGADTAIICLGNELFSVMHGKTAYTEPHACLLAIKTARSREAPYAMTA